MEIISKKEVDFHYTSSRLKSNYFPGGGGEIVAFPEDFQPWSVQVYGPIKFIDSSTEIFFKKLLNASN